MEAGIHLMRAWVVLLDGFVYLRYLARLQACMRASKDPVIPAVIFTSERNTPIEFRFQL
jgi:hypothetical protein